MKYFSLFTNKSIKATPGHKIIPSGEFSQALHAYELVEIAKKEIEEHWAETKKQCREEREKAYKEGYQEGLETFNKLTIDLNEQIQKLREEFQQKILPIALKAAKKILGEELKLHPERITDIVIQALKPVTQHHKVIIYVNKADIDTLEKNKPRIKKILEQVKTFSIQERMDVEPGGCIIETEAGIINAQLENQWHALETAFESFMRS